MKFSIIIPIYNAQRYLEYCLQSLVEQDYRDYEVILVNDGSTDGCDRICRHYAEKYCEHVRYYEQENKGQYAARMFGIEQAKGEYCCFVDADDAVTKDYFKVLDHASKVSQADILLFDFEMINENGNRLDLDTDELLEAGKVSKSRILELLILSRINAMWNKAYRRTLFKYVSLSDVEMGVRIGEDLLMNIPLVEHAETFFYSAERIYQYRKNRSSISYNIGKRSIMDVDVTRNAVYQCMVRLGIDTEHNRKLFYEQYLEEVGRELRYTNQKQDLNAFKQISEAEHMVKAEKYLKNSNIPKWKKVELKLFYEKKWRIMSIYCRILIQAEKIYEFCIARKVKNGE